MTTLHPLTTTEAISSTYLRYLRTTFPVQDATLRERLWEAYAQPDMLVKGPLLEAAPPFLPGRSIRELVQAGILTQDFTTLRSDALPLDRPLYRHQEQAITRIVQHGRNVIVATGTGSGKTESFLIPILDHLLREAQNGTLSRPGVRALLLYPMNALANDQLKRLRRILANYPAITFGRYTGETKDTDTKAEDAFGHQFPGEQRLSNEFISRAQMRAVPPHILLTNYSMLEYLLLRPEDCSFFDGPTSKHWRFLVLDEAHTYDGASGMEVAMLLRRFKDRIVQSEPGHLRCIATSATLGDGREDYSAACKFASELFGEPFVWDEQDAMKQDVIAAEREQSARFVVSWGKGEPSFYHALQAALPQGVRALQTAAAPYVPDKVLAHAAQQVEVLGDVSEDLKIDVWLYHILNGDSLLYRLHTQLGTAPALLLDIANQLFPHSSAAGNDVVALITLAVRARPSIDTLPLLPARYHLFARALEGAFACLNGSKHPDGNPYVSLKRFTRCPLCDGAGVELAACSHCGATYIVVTPSGTQLTLSPGITEPQTRQDAYYLLSQGFSELDDEDEAVASADDVSIGAIHLSRFCLGCGAAGSAETFSCECKPGTETITVRKLPLSEDGIARRCLACGTRSTLPIISRFLTGQDGPASVLATALYQQLPDSPDTKAAILPGRGRKLLIFSDSRQDAAFFAPYLERTYQKVLQRRLIVQALLADSAGLAGELRMEDIASRLLKLTTEQEIFSDRMSRDEKMRTVMTWLMQEFVALDRRNSLAGAGVVQFRLVPPRRWQVPPALQTAPWATF